MIDGAGTQAESVSEIAASSASLDRIILDSVK